MCGSVCPIAALLGVEIIRSMDQEPRHLTGVMRLEDVIISIYIYIYIYECLPKHTVKQRT